MTKALMLLLALTLPALADEPGNGNICINVTGFRYRAQAESTSHNWKFIELDGLQTIRFLDYINHKVGKPSAFRADSLMIEVREQGALAAIVRHGCVEVELIKMDPIAFTGAYAATSQLKAPFNGS